MFSCLFLLFNYLNCILLYFSDKTIPKSNLIDRFRSEKWSMWSLQKGLQMLPETLGHRLKNAEICLNTPCVGLEIARNRAKVQILLF